MPCVPGRIIAPNANVTIDSLSTEGFIADTCMPLDGGLNDARCSATAGDVDVIVNCIFAR